MKIEQVAKLIKQADPTVSVAIHTDTPVAAWSKANKLKPTGGVHNITIGWREIARWDENGPIRVERDTLNMLDDALDLATQHNPKEIWLVPQTKVNRERIFVRVRSMTKVLFV
jgi:hypothetical protein